MTLQEYRKRSMKIFGIVMTIFYIATTLIILIFYNYTLLLLFGGVVNGWLVYKVHTELLHQLNLRYAREYKEEKPLDND